MLSDELTFTVKYNKKHHIIKRFSRYTLCCQYLHNENGEKYETLKSFDKPPTCSKCIKEYFNKENEYLRLAQTARVEEENELSNAFRSLFEYGINIARDRLDIHRPKFLEGSYPFIPYSSTGAYVRFRAIKKWMASRQPSKRKSSCRTSKFLDAGCGIGNILLIAKKVGLTDEYHGLEYFDYIKNEAEHFLGLDMKNHHYNNIIVKKADIATYKHYGKYDFIYYYCPFSDNKKEMEFELRIEDQMKVGAILIPMRKNSSAIIKDKRFKEIQFHSSYGTKDIWEKISE